MLPIPKSIASKSFNLTYLNARMSGSTALGRQSPSGSCAHAARQGMHSGHRRLDHGSTGCPAPSRPVPLPLRRLRGGFCRLARVRPRSRKGRAGSNQPPQHLFYQFVVRNYQQVTSEVAIGSQRKNVRNRTEPVTAVPVSLRPRRRTPRIAGSRIPGTCPRQVRHSGSTPVAVPYRANRVRRAKDRIPSSAYPSHWGFPRLQRWPGPRQTALAPWAVVF